MWLAGLDGFVFGRSLRGWLSTGCRFATGTGALLKLGDEGLQCFNQSAKLYYLSI
ncbi:MAG: hypothetical protein M3Y72_16010 [Acidobacteriota bacterium]|nr:hypothetical protein [Acidobacteriota bacterium]